MSNATEHTEPHARLTLQEVKELWKAGILSAPSYLYLIIRAQRRNGWRFRIQNINEFCKEFEMHRATFYRAKAKLIDAEQMQEEIHGTIDLWIPSNPHDISVLDEESQDCDTGTGTLDQSCDNQSQDCDTGTGTLDQSCDSKSQCCDSVSQCCDNDPPKSIDFISSWRSYRSLTDLLQLSLSQEELSEIEKLIGFVAACNPTVRSPRPYSRKALDQDFHFWLDRYEQSLKTREEISIPPRGAPAVENFSALEMEILQIEREWAIAFGNTHHRAAIAHLIARRPELGLKVEGDRLVRVGASA